MTNIVSQISVHQQHELLAKLEAAGLTGPLAQKVIESRGNALAKDVVVLILGPQPDYPSYPVTIDYSQTVEALIRTGHYDWANDTITSSHFPLTKRGKEDVEVVVVSIDRVMTTEAIVQKMDDLSLRRPNVKEGLALGAQHPDLQCDGPIAILCEPWRYPHGGLDVPWLCGVGSDRFLNLIWFGGDWDPHWRFAAVRK